VALVPRLVPRYGERRIAIVCLAGQVLAALASAAAPDFWLLAPTVVLRHAVSSFVFPTLAALTANRVSPREQGALMGVSTALSSLAAVLGPLWAGAAYDGISPAGPYWLGAALFAAAMLLLLRVRPSLRCRGVE
jgi:DHA1 family tetracycline resistance protein-like MFS transporter